MKIFNFILIALFLTTSLSATTAGRKTRSKEPTQQQLRWLDVHRLDSLHKIYNEQMYLRTSQDSGSFFMNVYELYQACLRLDSVDEKHYYHHRTTSLMKHNARNLFSAGKYYYSHQNWDLAWDILSLVKSSKYTMSYASEAPVNYWLTLSALHMKKPHSVLQYIDMAMNEAEPAARPVLMEDKSHCFISLGDTLRWRQTMEIGYRQYPDNAYFRTYAYYLSGLRFCNQALAANSRVESEQLYQQALPLMEEVRKQWPDQIDKWGNPLYRIYLNLNMGSEFDEIDSLLRRGDE